MSEDETDRNALRTAIIAALPELDADALKAAMIQNRAHLQMILDAFKLDVSAASSWASDKAQDLSTRLSGRLQEPAVSKLLAEDAEVDAARWMSGALKPRAARRSPQAAPAIEEQTVEREPVALGALIGQLVPVVRRTPQPAPAAASAQPAWWPRLVARMLQQDALYGAKVATTPDAKASLTLVQMVLSMGLVELVDGVAWVSPGAIPASEIGDVTTSSRTWERVLTWLVREEGVAEQVRWSIKPLAEQAETVKEEPKAALQVHGPRPVSARPAWWAELLGYLAARAGRAQHQEGDPALAGGLKALVPLLKGARTARLCGDELVIELDSLGALGAVWLDVVPHLARGVGLYADLLEAPRVVVHELDGQGEVAP